VAPHSQSAQEILIDDTFAAAHACLAYILLAHDWDWPGAERESRRAVDLAPNIPDGHHVCSQCCLVGGRSEEAIAEARTTLELDPLSLPNHLNLAMTYQMLREHDTAIEQLQQVLELDSSFVAAHHVLALSYACTGRHQEALAEADRICALSEGNARVDLRRRGLWGEVNVMAGKYAEGRRVAADLAHDSKPPHFCAAIQCAAIHALLGEKDAAFEWLDNAYRGRASKLFYIKLMPEFETLHMDPRFADLQRRMGVPD
jgi:serine/threonine-protein kinase